MIPLWRQCATRGALSLTALPTATISCQPASSRLSLWIYQSHASFSFVRSISSSAPPRRSILEHSRIAYRSPQNSIRYYASLRRPATRRPDQSPANQFSKPPSSSSPAGQPSGAGEENVGGLAPKTADAKDGALSTDATGLRVGSKEWYEFHSEQARERARVDEKLDPEDISAVRRLFPSFVFLLAVLGGCFYYATTYTPPKPQERIFPNMPIAVATVAGIVGANFVVFLAWRVRPWWKFLNKYFVQRPGNPTPFGIIGSTFSHHKLMHFGANMVGLFFLGTTLCDQIGRGNFLALYLASGALSSFGSLALNVFLRRFYVFGLGASGAVFGVLGGFATLNPDNELYFVLLPIFTLKAVTIATMTGVWEFTALIFGWSMWMDHMAHLGGLLSGAGLITWLKSEAKRRREEAVKRQLRKV
ncbi:hypothetical protein H072_11297 [Dactylellina haptotyla CBS 200.50]|uniref:Peptidase S54 rhomboid domain-containing protein n=1 Tax=Dactylellina haptotyla (strain CBS 200.50) TaxID=1284197 RepID=S8BJ41_DACHA|nr:hypothetical protein H072_11297 [Dactylellina haptotyla CBS 200.50]